MSKWED